VDISTAADGLSDTINLTGLTLSSIQMSTAWTSARLAFLGNVDGSTDFFEIRQPSSEGSTAVSYSSTANQLLVFDPNIWHGVQNLQIASINTGTTAAVAQTAARTITLGLSEITKRS
jgi:hypothetical protein